MTTFATPIVEFFSKNTASNFEDDELFCDINATGSEFSSFPAWYLRDAAAKTHPFKKLMKRQGCQQRFYCLRALRSTQRYADYHWMSDNSHLQHLKQMNYTTKHVLIWCCATWVGWEIDVVLTVPVYILSMPAGSF